MSPAAAPALALLDVGPTEFLLVAALFLVLFGADRIPDLARSLGRATAQLRGATREFQAEVDRERGIVDRPGDAVPPDMKAQLAAAEAQAMEQLRAAARALGIDPKGKDETQLRAAIAGRLKE